jgi:hypothetical protein
MSIAGVTGELLVRYLDVWTPTALHAGRRATFALAWSGAADADLAESALGVFGEFADRLRGRQLTVVAVAPEVDRLAHRLDAARARTGVAAGELNVHTVEGDGGERLPVAIKAAGAARAPLFAYLDVSEAPSVALRAVATGKPAETLLVTAAGTWPERRDALRAAGFTLTAGVELVDTTGGDVRLVAFATSSAKSLEAFKNSLWSVDEYAGVRYRDPGDPDGHLLDISLRPHPGPLRRELLNHLREVGARNVTDLRRFTLTDTVYRASDAAAAITSLLSAGAVTRDPTHGRLSGDVTIRAAT